MLKLGSNPNAKQFTWVEGLALGAADFVNEWAANHSTDTPIYSLRPPSNSSTMSRASLNGIVTGKILENAYFIKVWSLDAYDLIRFLITNEGPNNADGTWDYAA